MTLAELGAQLRDERVGQGLMVEDVAARLKIPARILRAIEEGDVNDLPHTVYTRGFIKGYGLILGYSGDRIMELLDSLEDFDEDFSPHKTLESQPMGETANRGGKRRGAALLLKLLVITLLGAGGYAYYTHTFRDGGATSVPSTDAAQPGDQTVQAGREAAPGGSPSSSASSGSPVSAGTAPAAPLPGAQEPVSRAMPEASAPSLPSVSAEVSPGADEPLPAPLSAPSALESPASSAERTAPGVTRAAGPASEADPVATRGFATLPAPDAAASGSVTDGATGQSARQEAALPAGMHQIVLTAEAECWVHANADGTDTRQFSLKAGETFAMPFKKSMVLRLGNAGGVKIKYDGQDMPSPGSSGQVKTITFPPKQ